MGWRAGDRIGLATTSRGRSTIHTIESIGPAKEWKLSLVSAVAGVEHPQWNEEAIKAIDGNLKTRWSSWCAPNCGKGEQWLAISLSAPSHVTKVRIHFSSTRYPPKFSIDVRSSKSGPWQTAKVVTNGKAGWNVVTVDRGASAIRLVADWASMSGRPGEPDWAGNGVHEVEVYGREDHVQPPTVLRIREPVEHDFWGGFRELKGYRFEMAAEVVNLERSVLITGDHDDFESSMEGLHTMQGLHGGVMDVRYARVEYCGQRDILGRYCLHFHHAGDCPKCVFKGNAIYESQQIGITIHGTHRSLTDSNVVWDARAVGIYTEDGNEMYNVISNNAIICSWWEKCSVTWQNHVNQVAGIFMIGMTNDVIGNHIAGHENCIWTNGAARANGHGAATNKVCVVHAPFGRFKGNVNHDCQRFGLYPDNQHPRMLKRDSNGFVTDWSSCNAYTADGKDNGMNPANVIEDEFDYHNMFVGAYDMGNIRLERFVSVNNHASLYWKTSKNFADGTWAHVKDAVFAADPSFGYGSMSLLAPNGAFTFGLDNVTFVGGHTMGGALKVGQHCGRTGAGSPCNAVYYFEKVDFSKVNDGEPYVKFGVNELDPGARVLPVLTTSDGSLDGFKSIVSQHLNGFGNLPGCSAAGKKWENGYGCDKAMTRINVWGSDAGTLDISGPGYSVAPDWSEPTKGMNSGKMLYSPLHGGYGAPVIVGESYSISGNLRGNEVVDFGDKNIVDHLNVDQSLQLNIGSESCTLKASVDRRFVGSKGQDKNSNVPRQPCGAPASTPPHHRPTPSPSFVPRPPSSRPTPVPVPTHATEWKQESCANSGGKQLFLAEGLTFEGVEIRTDRGVALCRDCAARCWLQMSGTCVGFTFMRGRSGDTGDCTYFSSIDGTVAKSGAQVITTQRYATPLTEQPTPAPTPPKTPSPTPPPPQPTPEPTPTTTPSTRPGWKQETCASSGGQQLFSADGLIFKGAEIRTDGSVALCRDCAARCWLQMSRTCVGFTFTKWDNGDTGECTYFSSIDGTLARRGTQVVTTQNYAEPFTQQPTPEPTPPPAPPPSPPPTLPPLSEVTLAPTPEPTPEPQKCPWWKRWWCRLKSFLR
eukprot:TRINITY_DN4816_c0_g2_i1.p1 TRINITY_DN4816_c0_g2~~TRINITY_DN4816_c0_g2_i1.p1  ORF type:complete len:1122 (-),score=90.09 TRINITY_DN4816_c0_g2_i1:315-3596(-)